MVLTPGSEYISSSILQSLTFLLTALWNIEMADIWCRVKKQLFAAGFLWLYCRLGLGSPRPAEVVATLVPGMDSWQPSNSHSRPYGLYGGAGRHQATMITRKDSTRWILICSSQSWWFLRQSDWLKNRSVLQSWPKSHEKSTRSWRDTRRNVLF